MTRFATIGAIAIGALIGVGADGSNLAMAQNGPGDVQNGLRLSQQWCAECHVIARNQTRAPNAAVPTWPSIADNPATTEFRLRAFFQTPHQNMPNIALSRSQADDIITYILSLKSR